MKLGILDLVQPPFALGLLVDTIPDSGLSALPANITKPVLSSPVFSSFPAKVRDLLSILSVEELHMAYDDEAIVYYGKVQVAGDGLAEPGPKGYKPPSGHIIEPGDLGFEFRITFPRAGSASLSAEIDNLFNAFTSQQADIGDLRSVLNLFGGKGNDPANIPSDYPTKNFRIEFLFNSIIIHLPSDRCIPARIASDGWLEPDPDFDEVTIHLPKIAMSIRQNEDDYDKIDTSLDGWGINSLDDETSKESGQIAMKPALCLNGSGTFGMGLDRIVADFSRDFTPPEIIEKNFGVGDEFRGLWIPKLRVFIAPSGIKGKAFDTWGENLLYDMEHGFSGEIGLQLLSNINRDPLEVEIIFYNGKERKSPVEESIRNETNNVTRESHIISDVKFDIQVRIKGGKPPYRITVKNDGVEIQKQLYNNDPLRFFYPVNTTVDVHEISVRVEDSLTPNARFWQETITANCVDVSLNTAKKNKITQPAQLEQVSGSAGFRLVLASTQPDKDAVHIKAVPDRATITVGAVTIPRRGDGIYSIPVDRVNGTKVNVTAVWKPEEEPEIFQPFDGNDPGDNIGGENVMVLPFIYDHPRTETAAKALVTEFYENPVHYNRAKDLMKRRKGRTLRIQGYAAKEDEHSQADYNQKLSERRVRVLKQLLVKIAKESDSDDLPVAPFEGAIEIAHGMEESETNNVLGTDAYRVAIAFYDTPPPPGTPDEVIARVWREKDKEEVIPSTAEPTPHPEEAPRPSAFRKLGGRFRLQRSDLVFLEIFGEFDVVDETRRSGGFIQAENSDNGNDTSGIAGAVKTAPGASADPENQGILDFKISVLYDTATGVVTQTLAVGFDQNNARDGFVHISRFNPNILADTMASLLLFAPLIQGNIEAIQNADSDAERTQALKVGAAVGLATTLGMFAIKMEKVTLFGVQLTASELVPKIYKVSRDLTNVGMLLDYAVDFKINFDLYGILTVRTKEEDPSTGKALKPPRARYKAIGFNLIRNDETGDIDYQPVFDTSKGYELSLGDPGALEVLAFGVSLNNLLRILSARLRKENPMVLEVDLAMNVNLGIVTVDTVRVRMRIEDNGDKKFEIIPTKVSVNIPGVLTGTGYLDFGNNSGDGQVAGTTGGFQGFVDITLVPVKLRIAASVGIKPINTDGRDATAFFLGMEVELPSAIPLGGSGLGIYGFLGLFAMHYKRLEAAPVAGQLPPALSWFYNPPVRGNVINIQGWGPELDKWSFGLGVILGTMEGGFVLNMKGMFILELPGPRILIFVKASLLSKKPDNVKDAGHNISVGVLAIIDLDFALGRLTIGLILEYNIESVLSLRVPVVSQFNFDNPKNWFLDLGSHIVPASAEILDIVRGYAYLMIHGDGIPEWPVPGQPSKLPSGFSLAFGVRASLIFGDKDSGLYLEVGGSLDAGISFSPMHFYGLLRLKGQLHLWIVSISAHADLEVEGPNPHTYIHGKACGKVEFFFFSVGGCVEVKINSPIDIQPPPDLLTSVTLVSRSSALLAGQGIDRPIDGALGRAAVKNGASSIPEDQIPVVPIDSIPVINLFATPDVNGCTTFTDPIAPSSTYTQDGWVSTGAKQEVRYKLTAISLNQSLLENGEPKPVRFWKKPTDKAGDMESSVDMALLCWSPDPTPRAVQRSKELVETVTDRWEIVCKQIAPATSVFYCFNQKPVGYNAAGWLLNGIVWPDPPGTIRSKLPDSEIHVYENAFPDDIADLQNAWLSIRESVVDHAEVIGAVRVGRILKFPFEAAVQPAQTPGVTLPDATIGSIKNFEAENILIDCGELGAAEILLALAADILEPKEVMVRTLDANFNILAEGSAVDIGFTVINTFSDLPGTWMQSGGPWVQDTSLVMGMLLMLARQNKHIRILLHYKGIKQMRFIQIVTRRAKRSANGPSLYLGAMEMLTAAEFQREEHDTHTQQLDNDALNDALLGERARALLKPNTRYELKVEYAYQRRKDNELVDENFVSATPKTFVFKTDSQAPLRMDPWILATTPQNDMRYHFKDEPVQVYLNDESVIQLYKAYNVVLVAKVLKANGNHPPVPDPATMTLDMANISQVKKIKAAITTPYLHTLQEVVASTLPCVSDSGSSEEHVVFTIGVELLLNTEYTVEITKKGVVLPPANTYRTPLYKFAFRTSRYATAEVFADAIRSSKISTMLVSVPFPAVANDEISDTGMQDLLLNAGITVPAVPGDIRVSMLWSSTPQGSGFVSVPEALLIDTPEPLWRRRSFPDEEIVTSESGPMTHWVMIDKYELEIREATGSTVVQKLVRTQGGARTLVLFKPGAAGQELHLEMKRHLFAPRKEDYDTAATTTSFEVLRMRVPTIPPWEEEE